MNTMFKQKIYCKFDFNEVFHVTVSVADADLSNLFGPHAGEIF